MRELRFVPKTPDNRSPSELSHSTAATVVPSARVHAGVLCAKFLVVWLSIPGASAGVPPSRLLAQIQQLIQAGSLVEARQQLNAALKDYPSSAALNNFLGVVEAQSGNYRLAESSFRKAIELDSHLTATYLNLGRLYQENGRSDKVAVRKAAQVYLDLLKIDPENAEARYQAAYMQELGGSYQASLELLARMPVDVQQKPQVLAVRCADEAGLGRTATAAATAKHLLQLSGLEEADVLIVQPVVAAKKQQQLETLILQPKFTLARYGDKILISNLPDNLLLQNAATEPVRGAHIGISARLGLQK